MGQITFAMKYNPASLKEFVNHKEAVDIFIKWASNWKPGGKALLFHGIPGTGKTALVSTYAKERNFEFIEMNASDFRSAQQIQKVIGQSMKQIPLFKKSKIFLIDEIDGIAGREDLGGVGAIIKIIKESKFPVVMTANDPWSQKLRALRQHCQMVQFKKIPVFDIEKRLREICGKEEIAVDGEVLKGLARNSKGDLRSAINDLEIISQGRRKIAVSDLEILGSRERETNIFQVLSDIFKARSAFSAKTAISQSDKTPEEIFWWIENNIANEYEKPEEVARAYEALSIADIFRQRIMKRQNWRMLAYMIDMMTAGVSTAKIKPYAKFTRYQYPSNIIILGRSKEERGAAKQVLVKLCSKNHCSIKKFKNDVLPFFKLMLKNKSFRKNLEAWISKDEIEDLKGI